MKKIAFIFALLMATKMAIGQTDYDVLPYFSAGDYNHAMRNVMQMHDETVLSVISLADGIQGAYGWCFLKVSRDCAEVLDTVIIEDHTPTFKALMEPNPDGEGYLFATIKTDESLSKNYLRICRFDDDLVFDTANEIRVPLEDSISIGSEYFYLDDNDIILYYLTIEPEMEVVLSRFGTDGSLKHRQVIADSLCPINQPFGKIKVWSESPKKYVVNGRQLVSIPGSGASFVYDHYCVLDSLFGIEEMVEYASVPMPGSYILLSTENDDFVSLEDSTFIFTTGYQKITTHISGTQVTRRNKRTHENLKTVYFPHDDPTGLSANNQEIGIQKSSDNSMYVAFFNNGIVITKMDMALNVIWQRRYNSSTQNEFGYIPIAFAPSMRALDDGGLAVGGDYSGELSSVFIFTLGADGTSTPEADAFLRPYLFYPNPVQDQLLLQYSPDVQPKTIELYDLQGRLVLKQAKDMESVDMQGLAPGQYLLKVTLEDGKSYTDKVMKE